MQASQQKVHVVCGHTLSACMSLMRVTFNVGTAPLIESQPDLLQAITLTNPDEQLCHKDTGKGKRLTKWSRGHQFIVRGGGHIDTWQPLYM